MQLNPQEHLKEKPIYRSVSMEEQGDKYLPKNSYLPLYSYKLTILC